MASSKNKWLALLNIPFQMGIIIVGFAYLGMYLDDKYEIKSQVLTIIGTLLGVAIALYNVIRQLNQLNNSK